ncbi:conjugal transfer protein [Streptantibioticus ferralitis]
MEAACAADEWDVGVWRVGASTGAVAQAAGLARRFAWLLLFSGPFLGGAALLSQAMAPAHAVEQGTAAQRPVAAPGDQVGPAGWADLYVDAYVAAGQGGEQQLAAYYPAAAQLRLSGTPGAQHAVATDAVHVQQVGAGYWAVTVAVQVADLGKDSGGPSQLRYFQVPVRSAGKGFVAAALPAAVSAPGGGAAPTLAYGQSKPATSSDPATATVSEFLSAYLTGNGDLTRDLSPGTVISPISPAPYASVSVTDIAQVGGGQDGSSSTAVPADGTRRQVLVDVEASDTSGVARPLTYAIELRARAGRWEVDQLQSAPRLAGNGPATTSGAQQ